MLRTTVIGCLLGAAVVVSAPAHDHRPDWADAKPGVWCMLAGPSQVRGDAAPWVIVHILNVSEDAGDLLRVELLDAGRVVAMDERGGVLAGVAAAVDAWRRADADLALLSEQRALMSQLMARQARAAGAVCGGMVSRRLDPPAGACGDHVVRVVTELNGVQVFTDVPVRLTQSPPLPRGLAPAQRFALDAGGSWQPAGDAVPARGETWLAGDQHLHTTWSLDAHVLDGTEEGPAGYADAARAIGLDWIMLTDHSNVHAWWGGTWYFTPEQHELARQEAAAYRASEVWPVLYSQEMGLGRTGFWDLASHMLVYPLDTFAAPYLENPSSGLIFGHADCEDEQVIIDRINGNGCYGFIAHPYEEGTLSFAQWDWNNGAEGWAGLELWSHAGGIFQDADLSALLKWHELLQAIAPPSGGHLAERPGYPTRFPVGLGNSDAHETGSVGAVFTYAPLDIVVPSTLRDAFLSGHCVVSDGPLVTLEANTAGIGEVAILPDGRARTTVRLETTSEFGTVDHYTFVLEKDGGTLLILPTGEASGYAVEFVIDSPTMFTDGTYLTAWAQRDDLEYLAMTNPVWLQPSLPGDVDGSGGVDVNDMLAILGLWGPCEGCPADTNGDGLVDVNDVLVLLANWTG